MKYMSEMVMAKEKIIWSYPTEGGLFVGTISIALLIILTILIHVRLKNAREMKKALFTDTLTGYPNYRTMTQEASALLRQSKGEYALAYLDIYRFKVINDTFGYKVGDWTLMTTSDTLSKFVKADERFARLYADVFVLLLRFEKQDKLQERLKNLLYSLEELSFPEGESIHPLFRCGVYPIPAGFSDLDQACDRANYAKDSIQNYFTSTVAFYDDVMRKRLLKEKELENSMQPALEGNEFTSYYQPKINTITGRVVGAEALIRWNHPAKGLLYPGEFLPFYEKNGFIAKLDMLVFEQVCQNIREWMKKGMDAVPVSVNFSRHNMRDSGLPQKLMNIVEKYDIPPELLEVEITETQELENMEVAMEFVNSLKSFGFNVSIDDYGTGYSSISFLQKLPLDSLKLDRAFILNAMESDKARDIMRHLVAAMQQNRIRVMCEGVETREQRDFVVGLDCRFIQGFYYSRALPKEEFETYLRHHGTEVTGNNAFSPIMRFDASSWGSVEEFLNRSMPSWYVCCLTEAGYPVQFISPHFLDGMGYSASEFEAATGGKYVNWIHPDDLPQSLKRLERREKGQELLQQYRIRKKDGSYLWMREINKSVLLDDGREALLSVCTDISDLVQIRAENSRLINTVPGGVGKVLLTKDAVIVQQATDNFYQELGYSPEQLMGLGNDLCNLLYQKDMPLAVQQLQKFLHGETFSDIIRIKWPDESSHWLSIRGTAYPSREGICATVIIFNSDKEVQAQRTAEISKAQLELALTQAKHAVFEYDIKTHSIESYSGFDIFGIPEGLVLKLPGRLIREHIIFPDDVGELYKVLKKMLSGEAQISCEIRIRSSFEVTNASYSWNRITLSVIFDEEAQPVRAVGLVEDINQQRECEDAVLKEAQFRKVFTKTSLLALEINLTQDVIRRVSGTSSFLVREASNGVSQPKTYSAITPLVVEAMVAPEDREYYLSEVSRENLLRLYHKGIFEREFEYRRIGSEEGNLWNGAFVYLLKDQLSGDVICYTYHRDINERKLAEQVLEEQASRDPLTGAYNRSAAERLIQSHLRGSEMSGYVQAFLMLDLNRFKELNDTMGHPVGDRYLLEMAEVLKRQLRSDDIVARMGGDEFAILVKNLPDEDSAVAIGEKLICSIKSIGERMGIGMETSASIGIALSPYHGTDFETLYLCADKAMYRAKKSKTASITLFGECEGDEIK